MYFVLVYFVLLYFLSFYLPVLRNHSYSSDFPFYHRTNLIVGSGITGIVLEKLPCTYIRPNFFFILQIQACKTKDYNNNKKSS